MAIKITILQTPCAHREWTSFSSPFPNHEAEGGEKAGKKSERKKKEGEKGIQRRKIGSRILILYNINIDTEGVR
jgi:hypothetical protein